MRLLVSGQLRGSRQQLLVLVLLPAQPVGGRDVAPDAAGSASNHASTAARSVGVAAQA